MKKYSLTQSPGAVMAESHNNEGPTTFPSPVVLNYLGLPDDSPILKQLKEEHMSPSVLVPKKDETLEVNTLTERGVAHLVLNAGTAACERLKKWEAIGLLLVVMGLHSRTNPTAIDRSAFDSFLGKVPNPIKSMLPRVWFEDLYQLLRHLATDVEARRVLRYLIDKIICGEVAKNLTPAQRKRYFAIKGTKSRRCKFLLREAGPIFTEAARGVQALAIMSKCSMELFRDHIAHVFHGREQLYFQFRDPN